MMRFAMVTTFFPPYSFGGDAAYVDALSRELVRRGHEVEVIHCLDAYRLLAHNSEPQSSDDSGGVIVHRLRSRWGMLSPLVTQQIGAPGLKSFQLKKILNRHFDVVNFHNISLIGGPALLKYSRAEVTLYTLHEHWLVCPTHIFWKEKSRTCDRPTCFTCSLRSGIPPQLWRYTKLRDRALENVDRLISPSHYTAQRHLAGGINRPISVLPLFSAIEQAAVDSPFYKLLEPYFLFVGRVTSSKGIDLLVESFMKAPDARLIVAGDGDRLDFLRSQSAHHPNIQFLGALRQPALAALYAGAIAVIVPSLAPETFCLAIPEAAAFGTPAIVRGSAGGAVEIVTGSGGGVIYNDERELISVIRRLAASPAQATDLGRRARSAYKSSSSLDQHLTSYLKIVEDVLAGKRRRPAHQA